jgi:hypothetical protein
MRPPLSAPNVVGVKVSVFLVKAFSLLISYFICASYSSNLSKASWILSNHWVTLSLLTFQGLSSAMSISLLDPLHLVFSRALCNSSTLSQVYNESYSHIHIQVLGSPSQTFPLFCAYTYDWAQITWDETTHFVEPFTKVCTQLPMCLGLWQVLHLFTFPKCWVHPQSFALGLLKGSTQVCSKVIDSSATRSCHTNFVLRLLLWWVGLLNPHQACAQTVSPTSSPLHNFYGYNSGEKLNLLWYHLSWSHKMLDQILQ